MSKNSSSGSIILHSIPDRLHRLAALKVFGFMNELCGERTTEALLFSIATFSDRRRPSHPPLSLCIVASRERWRCKDGRVPIPSGSGAGSFLLEDPPT